MAQPLNTFGLDQTVVQEIVRQNAGDTEKAQALVKQMADDGKASEERTSANKVRELLWIFPVLEGQESLIREVLVKCDWNVDNAITPLFEVAERHKADQERIKRAKKKGKRINAMSEFVPRPT
jgi:hypothetical protein